MKWNPLKIVNAIAHAVIGVHVHEYDNGKFSIVASVPMITRTCKLCLHKTQQILR
jgi:hypothetical protein